MKSCFLVGLMTLLLSAILVPAAFGTETRLFVLAGQSNMGYLGHKKELPDELKEIPGNVVFWGKDSSAYGLELTFAFEVAKAFPGDRIVIVKGTVRLSRLPEMRS